MDNLIYCHFHLTLCSCGSGGGAVADWLLLGLIERINEAKCFLAAVYTVMLLIKTSKLLEATHYPGCFSPDYTLYVKCKRAGAINIIIFNHLLSAILCMRFTRV
jgi:hypothetical protein